MADDREILKELWEGRIPVRFSLPLEEVDSGEEPESIYLMLPRLSYFPLVTDKVNKHFSKYVNQEEATEMWLAYSEQPLKWHYPIGVLYDLYGDKDSTPWNITVHFQDFPEDEILHCPSKEAVESQFMSMVKEADSLKHRAQIINNMQKRDHKQLWTALLHDRYDQFWSVNKKLMESSGDDMFKYIPFRIYQIDIPNIQKIFKPCNTEGEEQNLGELLHECVPHLWDEDKFTKRVVTHGIEMTLNTPVLWLSQNFSYPDNFLHLCLLDKTDTG